MQANGFEANTITREMLALGSLAMTSCCLFGPLSHVPFHGCLEPSEHAALVHDFRLNFALIVVVIPAFATNTM
jgi:hypothetical protein